MALNESSTENPICNGTASKNFPNFKMLNWAIAPTPFALPIPRVPSTSKFNTFVSPDINLGEFRRSFASAALNFFKLIRFFAAHNPVMNKLSSISSEFHSLCKQIHCRGYRGMNPLPSHNFAAVLPGDSVAGLVAANGILNFLNIYNTVLIVRLVLTWFPNAPSAIVSPLSTVCDPYLNIFRGIIPPIGGTLDLSPILAFLVLNAFTSTAAALPAELPQTGKSQETHANGAWFTDPATSQKKWMRRLQGSRSKSISHGGAS